MLLSRRERAVAFSARIECWLQNKQQVRDARRKQPSLQHYPSLVRERSAEKR